MVIDACALVLLNFMVIDACALILLDSSLRSSLCLQACWLTISNPASRAVVLGGKAAEPRGAANHESNVVRRRDYSRSPHNVTTTSMIQSFVVCARSSEFTSFISSKIAASIHVAIVI